MTSPFVCLCVRARYPVGVLLFLLSLGREEKANQLQIQSEVKKSPGIKEKEDQVVSS